MNELAKALTDASAAAPPSHILEALTEAQAHTLPAGAPHTIYQEVWHLAFWQQISIDWANGIETPNPSQAAAGFPSEEQASSKPWPDLRQRFLTGTEEAAALTEDESFLNKPILCPSPPGHPTRTMSVREQLISLAAHNAYHLGRIVLLRQLMGAWPPPSGGFSW